MTSDWPNLVRTFFLALPVNRFEAVPYCENGKRKLFGSYQAAYAYLESRPSLRDAWVIELYLANRERVKVFEAGEGE